MPTIYLLDTGPLGLLAHDRPVHRIPIQTWLVQEMTAGATVYISEVADYEVRRELSRLIRAGQLPASRLNRLEQRSEERATCPLREKKWHRGRAATQDIAESRVNATDRCATFFGNLARGSVASGRIKRFPPRCVAHLRLSRR
jgi:hypothetical protein